LNAIFIEQGMPQGERLVKLNQIAIHQMSILESGGNKNRKLLKWRMMNYGSKQGLRLYGYHFEGMRRSTLRLYNWRQNWAKKVS